MARQSENDQVQTGGWTDAEVDGDQPGANAFCMGGKDCPNKGKPARRNELYPVWKERPCHVFGTGYIVHWQSHFNAYCCVCVQDYVENLHIKGENHFLNMCKRRWKALIDNQIGKAKSDRSLKFQKMLHLEGDLKIRGLQLEEFPTDDELFMHWEEFCASYANAQKEHLLMQHEVVRDCIAS